MYPGKIKRSLCEKDAFTERGVICFHKAISHWEPIDCDVQESEFPDLTVPFGLKMYPSMIDVRDIPQWRGGLISRGDKDENRRRDPCNLLLLYPKLSLGQRSLLGGRKVSPQEGQRELRGAVPLHGHTALEGRELGVILELLLIGVLIPASPTNTGPARPLQSQQPLWGFKGHGRTSPGFLEWECQPLPSSDSRSDP